MFIVNPAWTAGDDDEGYAAPQKGPSQRMIEKYDVDKDGKLSDEEKVAARESMKTEGCPGGQGGVNHQQIIEHFDTDGDGKLSEEEREAAGAARQKEGPPAPEEP